MPKLLLINGFSFFFYSNENAEPPHVHVRKADADAKFWLDLFVTLDRSEGFNSGQLQRIRQIILEHRETFLQQWYDYFGPN